MSARVFLWLLYIVIWWACKFPLPRFRVKSCCVTHDDYKLPLSPERVSSGSDHHLNDFEITREWHLVTVFSSSENHSSRPHHTLQSPLPGHWTLVTRRDRGWSVALVWHSLQRDSDHGMCIVQCEHHCDSLFRLASQDVPSSALWHSDCVKCVYIGVRCPWIEGRQHNTLQSTCYDDGSMRTQARLARFKLW